MDLLSQLSEPTNKPNNHPNSNQNDYFDYLVANAGNNQMPTLNRDIQQLNLASNNITTLHGAEFFKKKFRNLQKIYLSSNKLSQIDSGAFYKLTGLIELDLSENLVVRFEESFDDGAELGDQDGAELAASESESLRTRFSGKRGSFLQDLGQLRLLNLASNKLKKLEKFAFSPLTQLRQLYLSR